MERRCVARCAVDAGHDVVPPRRHLLALKGHSQRAEELLEIVGHRVFAVGALLDVPSHRIHARNADQLLQRFDNIVDHDCRFKGILGQMVRERVRRRGSTPMSPL